MVRDLIYFKGKSRPGPWALDYALSKSIFCKENADLQRVPDFVRQEDGGLQEIDGLLVVDWIDSLRKPQDREDDVTKA